MEDGRPRKLGEFIGSVIKSGNPLSVAKDALNVVGDNIDRFVNSPDERAKAEQEVLQAIIETNKVEAAHRSIFVAGWRPFIGWVCGAGLAYQFVLLPLLKWVLVLANKDIPAPPDMNIEQLLGIIIPMLGLAGYRTYEKLKDKAK